MQYFVNLNLERYAVTSGGYGEPLVLLHGFTGTSGTWVGQFPAFEPHFEVIAPDLLGHGRTYAPPHPTRYTMQYAGKDLIALLDALKLQQVHLLGYSMGGRIALYTAVNYPNRIKSLILESASPGLKTEEERAKRRESDHTLAERIEQEGVESFVDDWEQLPLWASQVDTLSAEAKTKLREERLSQKPKGLANSLRGMGTGEQPSLWEHLADLDMPTLLIAGERDSKFIQINQEMDTLLPNSTLHIVENAGHTVHLEQPDIFNQTVLDFLQRVKP